MKLTKSQKIYLSVLGVGVCALVLDRSFGDAKGPTPATAAPLPKIDALEAGKGMIGSVTPAVGFESTVADRLRLLQASLGAPSVTRDAFAPSSVWVTTYTHVDGVPSQKALSFQNSHRLKAIVQTKTGGRAWVDNDLVSVGQKIDGFTLMSISHFRATFSDGMAQAELRLDSGATVEQPLQSH